ncbi:MAG: hypothetical protein U1C33_04880, partial [Candidatus Cloacimonadaceae bacterium]|nr:hypothetical protein [Candidatus Cloacimonadaceae bacterium]
MEIKRTLLAICCVLYVCIALAIPSHAVLFYEGFDSGVVPPEGWTIDAHHANWRISQSNYCRGAVPELWFHWSPEFAGTSYFISPMIDSSNMQQLLFSFKHYPDPLNYYPNSLVGVATRSAEGDWHVVWSMNPMPNSPYYSESVLITNEDVGSDQFQIALFVSGGSTHIHAWLADNLTLLHLYAYDLGIVQSNASNHMSAGDVLAPSCVVKNKGVMGLTPVVHCDIYEGHILIEEMEYTALSVLEPDGEITVSFPAFILGVPEEVYRIVYTLSSLEDVVDLEPMDNIEERWVSTWTHPRQKVLLEICSGIWSPYGPGTAMAAADLLDMGSSVAILGNHYYDSYANTSSISRKVLYDVRTFPTSIFDGVIRHVGGSFGSSIIENYLPIYEQRIPQN